MKNILNNIREYLIEFKCKNCQDPKTIPLSIEEIQTIQNGPEMHFMVPTVPDGYDSLFGIKVSKENFAEGIRTKRLQVPVGQYVSEFTIHDSMYNNSQIIKEDALNKFRELIFQAKTFVLQDVTTLVIEFEWDVFAGLKRLLHITKWFPIKTRKSIIDCRTLYPYCKVTFPHNKHTMKFSVK